MFLQQYNLLMSSLLKEKHALTKLREERRSCAGVTKGLGTWPETTEIKEGRKRGPLFPKINLKY